MHVRKFSTFEAAEYLFWNAHHQYHRYFLIFNRAKKSSLGEFLNSAESSFLCRFWSLHLDVKYYFDKEILAYLIYLSWCCFYTSKQKTQKINREFNYHLFRMMQKKFSVLDLRMQLYNSTVLIDQSADGRYGRFR